MTGDWGLGTGDLHTTLGHHPIYICGEAATFIPHSSYEQSFHPKSRDSMSPRLILNPEPQK